jgi:hypothetical protein
VSLSGSPGAWRPPLQEAANCQGLLQKAKRICCRGVLVIEMTDARSKLNPRLWIKVTLSLEFIPRRGFGYVHPASRNAPAIQALHCSHWPHSHCTIATFLHTPNTQAIAPSNPALHGRPIALPTSGMGSTERERTSSRA